MKEKKINSSLKITNDGGPTKLILDACCSGRMFWFDKKHPFALYSDIREVPAGSIEGSPNFEVKPDLVQDFRDMISMKDKSFKMVVFDPPHLKSVENNSWVAVKYGVLNPDTWKDDILKGFNECWRVLDDYGTLIFKWSKSGDPKRKRDITTAELLKVIPVRPLFGHPSGSKLNTIWMVFMKIPGHNVDRIPAKGLQNNYKVKE
jgi:hypothetical protein